MSSNLLPISFYTFLMQFHKQTSKQTLRLSARLGAISGGKARGLAGAPPGPPSARVAARTCWPPANISRYLFDAQYRVNNDNFRQYKLVQGQNIT